ncbi:hypothetical protein [Hyphomonas sp.]|uniref:hypothetical protein n=1 Tax=Hyphomonas sp. TaxID=87 RepID=UPI003002B631
MSEPPSEYEKRIVLFVDFLGFKEHVHRTLIDAEHISRVSDAMKLLGEIGDMYIGFESKKVSQFSDCLVVSYKINEESAVFWLVDAIATQLITLAYQGFLVRGAITVGQLFHTNEQVFGPALVSAYELESKAAVVPRVLIDSSVYKAARTGKSWQNTADQEEEYVKSFIVTDADGRDYIDYVSWKAVVESVGHEPDLHPGYLASIKNLIECGLTHSDPKVAGRYVWLQRQLRAAIEQVKNLPIDHPYRVENPNNCAVVESLDDLEELAEKIDISILPTWIQ